MIWSKVFSFGSQWGDDTIRLVEGDDALAMIRRVEGILKDSIQVLESHERVLSSEEFNIFSIKHRHLVLKVLEVKQEINLQQKQSIFSAAPAGRGSDRIARDVVRLHNQAEMYHQDVLTASRRAQIEEEERFLARIQQDSLKSEGSADRITTLYSLISSKSSTETLSQSESGSDSATLVGRHPYLAVAHFRPESSKTEGSTDEDLVREIYILEAPGGTVVMYNPNPCPVNEESNPLNESSVLEMSRAARALLRAGDSKNLQGYEVISNTEDETSWIDSFISSLTRLGVGIGADMV
ncbi:hypothetical protein OPQ81_003295 [Rhizoctonia solani]|nr:hypothetical protein OPQ81_003295 [Rhizoctonia solani]